MRITGGELRGLRYSPPAKNWPTRPTTDFAKEALHNILLNRIDYTEIKFLDLFGGTGAHCFECISRGCTDATYVDKFKPALKFVKDVAIKFKIENKINIIQSDVFKYLNATKSTFDLIFADPPYALSTVPDIPNLIFDNNLLNPEGILVIEHDNLHSLDHFPQFSEQRNYGQSQFSFFKQ